jgi:hypothetical protein
MRCADNQVCALPWRALQTGKWLPLQAMPAWTAKGTLHRASATAGATLDPEGALAPVIAAIVGVMGGGRGPIARLEGPPLECVCTSLPASAIALAPRITGTLRDGTVADGYRNTCGKEARHQSCTHGMLRIGRTGRWPMNHLQPPAASRKQRATQHSSKFGPAPSNHRPEARHLATVIAAADRRPKQPPLPLAAPSPRSSSTAPTSTAAEGGELSRGGLVLSAAQLPRFFRGCGQACAQPVNAPAPHGWGRAPQLASNRGILPPWLRSGCFRQRQHSASGAHQLVEFNLRRRGQPRQSRFPEPKSQGHGRFGRCWCPGAESNHRHRDFQSRALPTELPGRPAKDRTCLAKAALL